MAEEKILIVDDDDNCDRLRCTLEAEGYLVEIVESGEGALRSINNRTPDLIVSKVMLRDLGGIELIRQIRANQRWSTLPVLLYRPLTDQVKREALEAGVHDFLPRPIQATDLLARTRGILALARAEQSIQELKRDFDKRLAESTRSYESLLHAQNARLAQAEKSRAEIEATFNAIADAVVVTDRDGRIKRFNDSVRVLFGCKPAELSGRYCSELFASEKSCPHWSLPAMPAAVDIEAVGSGEFNGIRLNIHAQRIADPSGQVFGFAHMLRQARSEEMDGSPSPALNKHRRTRGAT
jgi:DNA-binding response OmpR family regulator